MKMLIDEFLPVWDEREKHSIKINAPVEAVWRERRIDLRKTCLTRFLFKLRGLRAKDEITLDELSKTGFVLLGVEPQKEISFGLTGKFWTPSGGLIRVGREDFIRFNKSDYAKAVWNFSLSETQDGATRLQTETRIFCTDGASLLKFKIYWLLIGAFSGLIRREMLSAIKNTIEEKRRNQADDFSFSV